jgi:hypothetical protein
MGSTALIYFAIIMSFMTLLFDCFALELPPAPKGFP